MNTECLKILADILLDKTFVKSLHKQNVAESLISPTNGYPVVGGVQSREVWSLTALGSAIAELKMTLHSEARTWTRETRGNNLEVQQ